MRHRLLAGLFLCAAFICSAEPALNTIAPLTPAGESSLTHRAPGAGLLTLASADRALSLGFPSIAADLYQSLLKDSSDQGLDRAAVRLSLVSAFMEDGRFELARQTLDSVVGLRGPAWRLRSALLNARARRTDAVRADLAGLRPDDFSGEDRAWFFFAQGLLADASGGIEQGRDFYTQAIATAESELTRVRFSLARERAFILRGNGNLDTLRANADRYAGQKLGFASSKLYASALAAASRPAEGVAVLQRLLQSLPSTELSELDEVRFHLGLIGGAAPGSAGRNALFRLLESGQDAERQRMALHLLSAASAPGPAGEEFVRHLDELISRSSNSVLQESLLLYRAEYFLTARNLEEASTTARTLLDRFPAGSLRVHALGVLTNAAWYGGRYLTAADFAEKTRALTSEGPLRARLGVLVAEAWYRAGSYRNAADSYAAVLRTPPPGVAPGLLMFQRVQSEIDAGDNLDAAATLLNDLSLDPNFDLESRWQAEWNLARALQAANRSRPAYERCTRLLANKAGAQLPASLRARMAWLQARLALDSGLPAEALGLAKALAASSAELPASLSGEIASLSALISAQAEFALNRPTDALSSLAKLRASFPKTDAAVYSIISEADYFVSQDRVVDAQARLRALADEYSESPYAPYALYRAALLAEQRGQDSNYKEANSLIEQLVKRYPRSDLVFYARLRQGSLLTRLNDFAPAEQTYEALVNQFPTHADILSARLALADCHSAQMGADPAHADRALELYEGLVAHPSATPDMRIEAGYKWGLSYSRRNEPQRAIDVWWRDVVGEFLSQPAQSARLGSTGRYWMARTLFELSELLARQGRTDESRRALQLIVDSSATAAYSALARARLSPPAVPTTLRP